jgi:tetratricopeptide (TPR) repeat protein
MDRRRSLLCALGLLTGSLGCISTHTAVPPPGATPPPVVAQKEEDLPKRTPKASTCVAFGNYRAGQAADAKVPQPTRLEYLEQARKAYQQALAIDPNYVPAYLSLANLYSSQEDYPRALDTYNKALKKNPKSAQVWEGLGMLHARKKEWDQAIASLKKAVELDPENRQYTRTLGLCLARAGRNNESLTCLAAAMPHAEACLMVARMLHHLQRDDESQRYARQALQEKPDLVAAREFLMDLEHPGAAPTSGVVTARFDDPRPQAAQ